MYNHYVVYFTYKITVAYFLHQRGQFLALGVKIWLKYNVCVSGCNTYLKARAGY